MSNPEMALAEAQRLRSEAATRLNDAAQCGDPTQRDELVTEALVLLAEARVLRGQAESSLKAAADLDAQAGPTSTGLQ